MLKRDGKKSLLIVEDDVLFRARLKRSMEKRGFRVISAVGVDAALREIAEECPDFAIIDLRLEDGSGLTVVEALGESSKKTRAIILTGYGDIPTALAAVRVGAVDYIAKPATAEEIVETLFASPNDPHAPPPSETYTPDEARLQHIEDIYERAGRNMTKSARLLGMHRRTLQRVMKRHDLGSVAAQAPSSTHLLEQ